MNKSKIINALIITIVVATVIWFLIPQRELPVYNPADINPDWVDDSVKDVRRNHTTLDFSLINQNGQTITQKDYQNSIYVTDFFFTRCQTICPVMSNNVAVLQKEFEKDNDVKFLSISVTPKIDSVSVLKDYAVRHNAIDGKWNITTGNKKHIYNLARKSYFATLKDGDGGMQDFIHTENFVLIDKKQQIRGIYKGTDTSEIEQLIKDIRLLQKE